MTKILICEKNSPWGVVVNPVSSDKYRHVISFDNNTKKTEFISDNLFEAKNNDWKTLLSNQKEIGNPWKTSIDAEFNINVNQNEYYKAHNYNYWLNSDIAIMEQDNTLYFFAITGSRVNENVIKFKAKLDIFFTYDIKNIFNNQDTTIERAHYDRFKAIVATGNKSGGIEINNQKYNLSYENQFSIDENNLLVDKYIDLSERDDDFSNVSITDRFNEFVSDSEWDGLSLYNSIKWVINYQMPDNNGKINEKDNIEFLNNDGNTLLGGFKVGTHENNISNAFTIPYQILQFPIVLNSIKQTPVRIYIQEAKNETRHQFGSVTLLERLLKSDKNLSNTTTIIENNILNLNEIDVEDGTGTIQGVFNFCTIDYENDEVKIIFRTHRDENYIGNQGNKIITAKILQQGTDVQQKLIRKYRFFNIPMNTKKIDIRPRTSWVNDPFPVKPTDPFFEKKDLSREIKSYNHQFRKFKVANQFGDEFKINQNWFPLKTKHIILNINFLYNPTNNTYFYDLEPSDETRSYKDFYQKGYFGTLTDTNFLFGAKSEYETYIQRNKQSVEQGFVNRTISNMIGGVKSGGLGLAQSTLNTVLDKYSLNAKLQDLQNTPNIISGNSNFGMGVLKGNFTHWLREYVLPDYELNKIQNYFYKYGVNYNMTNHNINDLLKTRFHFNYIQAPETFENITNKLSAEIKQVINDSLAAGITIWHYRQKVYWKGVKNYEYENTEMNIYNIGK